MSPIIARAGLRAASRRQFSLLSSMRSVGRSMEAHPFERLPVTQKAARGDWGKEFKRVGSQALYFFPAGIALLGWPFAAQAVLDGHM